MSATTRRVVLGFAPEHDPHLDTFESLRPGQPLLPLEYPAALNPATGRHPRWCATPQPTFFCSDLPCQPLRALLGHPQLTRLRQSRWFKPATRALAALLGVWALSWLSVPALVKGPLERMASEQLGRTVTVGNHRLQALVAGLTLRDIAVAGAKGARAQHN